MHMPKATESSDNEADLWPLPLFGQNPSVFIYLSWQSLYFASAFCGKQSSM